MQNDVQNSAPFGATPAVQNVPCAHSFELAQNAPTPLSLPFVPAGTQSTGAPPGVVSALLLGPGAVGDFACFNVEPPVVWPVSSALLQPVSTTIRPAKPPMMRDLDMATSSSESVNCIGRATARRFAGLRCESSKALVNGRAVARASG